MFIVQAGSDVTVIRTVTLARELQHLCRKYFGTSCSLEALLHADDVHLAF